MIGQHVGPYEVLELLGKGGMGEVYRARDARLGRDVAIKVLPAAFADDPERLARFTREAQVLAALNHANIAHIHGLESFGVGAPGLQPRGSALVMEFVDGDDLSVHIARGPMPLADVVPIAAQIATALETAHDQGIVHRDLKPANIKVKPDGTVKVLDFGLAKALTEDTGVHGGRGAEMAESPTLTARATAMGVILGTAAYMAPEQAKGKPVDRRADIWAFGVVLYEMLTGRRAFDGEDVSTTLAQVLMKEPDWGPLPASTPPAIRTLIQRCLQRDPRQRLRDIGEARILLTDSAATREATPAAAPAPDAVKSGRKGLFVVVGIIAAAIIIGTIIGSTTRQSAPPGERLTASLAPPKGYSFAGSFVLSPDGQRLVMSLSNDETGTAALWLRTMSSGQAAEIPHTENGGQPFWSPDGQAIAFFAEGQLRRVDLQGSPPQVICPAPSPRGGSWGPNNTIVFAGSFRKGLEKVDARGGKPSDLTTLDEKRGEKSHRWPAFLPDGNVLFLSQTAEGSSKDDASRIEVLTLATGARERIVDANSSPLFSTAGYVLFWREDALRAQAFDAGTHAVSGEVFTVAPGVLADTSERVAASIAQTGMLVYMTGTRETPSSLRVVSREGKMQTSIAEQVIVGGNLALSHDNSRVAIGGLAPNGKEPRILIFPVAGGQSTPLTFEDGFDFNPAWSADDSELAYTNGLATDGTIYRRLADGRGKRQLAADNPSGAWLFDWSKDGSWMLVGAQTDAGGFDVFRATVGGKTLTPILNSSFDEDMPALSADDRWIAYMSDETGRAEIYVRPLSGEGKWMVSNSGGGAPMWRRDGRELFYVTPRNQLMAVRVDISGLAPKFGAPEMLFRADFPNWDADRPYAPFADGKRFVINAGPDRSETLLTIVTNWKGPAK